MRLAEAIITDIQKAMEGKPIRVTPRLSVYAVDVVPVKDFYLVVMNSTQDLHVSEVKAFAVRDVVAGKICYLVPKELALKL